MEVSRREKSSQGMKKSKGAGARQGVETSGVSEDRPQIPSWFGEAVLWGKYWLDSGLVGYLEEEVRVVRGRIGQYEVMDFVRY